MKPSHLPWEPWGPRFDPACGTCVFLGRFDVFDLWFCAAIPTMPAVTARWNNDSELVPGIEVSGAMMATVMNVALLGSLQEAQHVPGPHAVDPVDVRFKCAIRVAYLVAKDRGLLVDWL